MMKTLRAASFLALLTTGSLGLADISSLPPALKSLAHEVEDAHNKGVGVFFRSLEEDCDIPVIKSAKYMRSRTGKGVPPLFRVESSVDASCLRREIWQCRSVFEGGDNGKAVYKYTDCETDAPLVEE